MAVRAVLVDIEGTTSAISFVHDVLFPYAREALPAFLHGNAGDEDVRREIEATAAEAGLDPADLDAIADTLRRWIDEDRKATPLKALQGLIWEHGYATGAYRAHVYDDAVEALEAWHAAGLRLYVYSSGSVHAQKLFFRHSVAGDLLPLFSGHFDTTTGPKREAVSYRRIATAIGLPAEAILFLSDVPEELDAAKAAGMQTTWVVRENEGRHTLAEAARAAHPAVAHLTDLAPTRT
ncbi:MAG: acireductone synthase [Pseudomonadales bacterium]|nr:acireductone synthase [Pseudomonadales bacterium]